MPIVYHGNQKHNTLLTFQTLSCFKCSFLIKCNREEENNSGELGKDLNYLEVSGEILFYLIKEHASI